LKNCFKVAHNCTHRSCLHRHSLDHYSKVATLVRSRCQAPASKLLLISAIAAVAQMLLPMLESRSLSPKSLPMPLYSTLDKQFDSSACAVLVPQILKTRKEVWVNNNFIVVLIQLRAHW
jgi:hypothetical protein